MTLPSPERHVFGGAVERTGCEMCSCVGGVGHWGCGTLVTVVQGSFPNKYSVKLPSNPKDK